MIFGRTEPDEHAGWRAAPGGRRAGRSEEEARFHAFVDARWASLVSTACIVTADRQLAEDCVQEALVRVHRHWARIAADGNPEAYARRAAINSALSWRRRRRIGEVALDRVPEPAAGGRRDDYLDDDLTAALRSLPPRMRAVVALRFIENLSVQETAHELGCSEGTVKSTAHKGLAKLREALGSRQALTAEPDPRSHGPFSGLGWEGGTR